jgi:hypothetical protein
MPKQRINQSAFQAIGKLAGQRVGYQQAQRQKAHGAIGVTRIGFERLRGHVALVATERHHVFELPARNAPRQFVQRGPDGKTGA